MNSKLFAVVILAIVFCITNSICAQSIAPPVNKKELKSSLFKQDVNRLSREIEKVRARLDQAERQKAEIRELHFESIERQSKIGVSPESYSQVVSFLQLQNVELRIDIAGLKARTEKIVELQKEKTASSDVVKHAAELVELLQKKYESEVVSRFKQGELPASSLTDAKAQLLQAKLNLAQSKAKLKSDGKSSVLLDLSLELAEKEARLDSVKGLLTQITSSYGEIDKSNQYKKEVSRIDEVNSDLMKTLQELEIKRQQLQILDEYKKEAAKPTK